MLNSDTIPSTQHETTAATQGVGQETPEPAGLTPMEPGNLTFSVGDATDDPDWDTFVATAPGGHYVQSSLWARVKATQGWQAQHVIGRDRSGQIVVGAQVLLKRVRNVATIAVAYKAPLIAVPDPEVETQMLAAIHRLMKQCRAIYCTVQPSEGGERMAERLQAMGYRPLPGWGQYPATTVVDLTQDSDHISRNMRRDARRNLRLAQRAGVQVREGTEADVELFYRLLTSTSQRRNFAIHPLEFYRRLWQLGAARGQVQLFFAELAGEALSAELALCFGDTVYGFKAARSGRHEEAHPNAALFWEIFMWAKSHGYRRYDFVGIDSTFDLSFKLVLGEVSEEQLRRRNIFKLGFGGDIVTSPLAYDYVPNPILRRLYRFVQDHQSAWRLINAAAVLVRGMARRH